MKTKYLSLTIISALCILLFSCETDITVDLPKAQEKIIVEGFIENNIRARVFLSKNASYFDVVDSTSLSDILIYDSLTLVTVTNRNIIDTLTPGFFPKYPYYAYTGTNKMIGQIGESYRLDITYQGNHIWAETTIPEAVNIDSVWFEYYEESDIYGTLGFSFIDPANVRNYYSLELYTSDEQSWFFPPYYGTSVFDDNLLDGDTINYSPLLKGYDSNDYFQEDIEEEEPEEEEINTDAYHKFGSTVNLKLSSINIEHYVFWTSYNRHLSTTGNPFTNPASIQSNINGENCEGIWGGYGSNILTVKIDESLLIPED